MLSSNRKLERKMKELSIQIDEERQHVNDQKDQVRTCQVEAQLLFLSTWEERLKLLGCEVCQNSQMRLGKDSIPQQLKKVPEIRQSAVFPTRSEEGRMVECCFEPQTIL